MSENSIRQPRQPRRQQERGPTRPVGVIPLRTRRPAPQGTTFDLVPILMARKHKDMFLRRVDAAIEELKESMPLPKTG